MQILRKNKTIICILLLLFVLYSLFIVLILNNTNIYSITPHTNNDRFFSMDDVYYVTNIYSTNMENTDRIVKHPLFMVGGFLFAHVERFIFGEISLRNHYLLIVFFQTFVFLLSVLFLYLILRNIHRLSETNSALLTLIYSLSFSTIVYTLLAESYIFSSCLLIMSYYFIRKKNIPGIIITGVLVTGVTITNCVIWAIMLFLADFKFTKKIILALSSCAAFLSVVAVFPVRNVFFTRLFIAGIGSSRNYSDSFPMLEALRRTFFSIFCTPFMLADTEKISPFGNYPGKAISFTGGAPAFTLLVSLLWLLLLLLACKGHIKSPKLYIPLSVLAFNIVFHGIIQYGLKEAFLYSLHHLFAQILILSNLFPESKTNHERPSPKSTFASLAAAAFLCLMIASNLMLFPGFWSYMTSL